MPFGITLLILFFICYSFGGLERVNPFQPPEIVTFSGMERVNPFQPPKVVEFFGMERANHFQPKKL
jgi:hypothetical protein